MTMLTDEQLEQRNRQAMIEAVRAARNQVQEADTAWAFWVSDVAGRRCAELGLSTSADLIEIRDPEYLAALDAAPGLAMVGRSLAEWLAAHANQPSNTR